MITEKTNNTALKIRKAATKLFGKHGFYNVSIKEIAAEAGTNSALISYYYGGKKQLYSAVIAQQSELIEQLQDKIKGLKEPALTLIYDYLEAIMKAQLNKDDNIGLLYREVLTPTGLCDETIGNHLRSIHTFTQELLSKAIEEKSLKALPDQPSAAFILESVTVLIFLVRRQLNTSFDAKLSYDQLLKKIITSYFEPYVIKN